MDEVVDFYILCRRKNERRRAPLATVHSGYEDGVLDDSQLIQNGNLPTRRERDVLLCMVDGKTDRQIAEHLNISQKTVQHHVRSLLAKIKAKNRTQAAVKAIHMGLIEIQSTITK